MKMNINVKNTIKKPFKSNDFSDYHLNWRVEVEPEKKNSSGFLKSGLNENDGSIEDAAEVAARWWLDEISKVPKKRIIATGSKSLDNLIQIKAEMNYELIKESQKLIFYMALKNRIIESFKTKAIVFLSSAVDNNQDYFLNDNLEYAKRKAVIMGNYNFPYNVTMIITPEMICVVNGNDYEKVIWEYEK